MAEDRGVYSGEDQEAEAVTYLENHEIHPFHAGGFFCDKRHARMGQRVTYVPWPDLGLGDIM